MRRVSHLSGVRLRFYIFGSRFLRSPGLGREPYKEDKTVPERKHGGTLQTLDPKEPQRQDYLDECEALFY